MSAGGFVAGMVMALLAGLVSRFTDLKEDANFAAFYLTTPLLFLDEPVDFLDFTATEFLYRSINDAAASGRSILLSSHIAESFTRCTRRLYVLSAGRMTGPFSTPEDSDAVAALVS